MSRIVVAMSGGVDSSVAAALVQRAGHQAIGATMKLLPRLETGFGCCGSPRDVDDAKRVCEKLGIPHYVVDMAELFERKVVDPFVRDYFDHRTPNPCVECNRSVKFGYLLALAQAWDAAFVATGHYARVEDGRLFRSLDAEKDQTYFLYSLTRRELRRVLFPVGGLQKAEVRRIARDLGLETAEKQESMEICFVPNRDYRGFVRAHAGRKYPAQYSAPGTGGKEVDPARGYAPGTVGEDVRLAPGGHAPAGQANEGGSLQSSGVMGSIRDSEGRELGIHKGLENYTIGQRRGLGVTSGRPLYVTGMDAASNTLYVGLDEETRRSALVAGRVSWTGDVPTEPIEAEARIRHRHVPAKATVTSLPERRVKVEFSQPQRAIAPGQAVVFYRGDEVLGGGSIERSL